MKTKKGNTLAVKLADSLLDEDDSVSSEETKSLHLNKGGKTHLELEDPLSEKTVDISMNHEREPSIKKNFERPTSLSSARPQRSQNLSSGEVAVLQSESLRVAQQKIVELEREVDRLRHENFELTQAGQLLQRKADELGSQMERAQKSQEEAQKILDEEKAIFKTHLKTKEKDVKDLRRQNEVLESRLETDFKRIRVRERELEHRLEMMKAEHSSIVRSKDEMVLDVRRKMDQLQAEAENYRHKAQELYKKLSESEDNMRRVVRALRIALTIVEGSDSDEGSGSSGQESA